MKAKISFDDGKVVELSQETTDKLRKELIKEDGQLIVDRFRAVKSGSGYLFALMDFGCNEWDGKMKVDDGNADATHYLMVYEVKEIIEGLQRMIGD